MVSKYLIIGAEIENPRISLPRVLDEWKKTWHSIVGREPGEDDPVLIPCHNSQLIWEDHSGDRKMHPRPLSLSGYYELFRRRGRLAGYPSLSAADFVINGGAIIERAF